MSEMLPEFVGVIDFREGTVREAGRPVQTMQEWVFDYQARLQETFYDFMDRRDLTSDIQGLPGNKPRFRDDWYYEYPEQVSNEGMYSWDLGYRSPP